MSPRKPPTPRPATTEAADGVEGPARLVLGHVLDRVLGAAAGAKQGYSNTHEHPLTAARWGGKITADEFAAGEVYRALYEAMGRSGRDSTDFTVVTGGTGMPATVSQVNAIRMIQAIEHAIKALAPPHGHPWISIVRHFVGEGWSAVDACRYAELLDRRVAWANVRLALNKLATAISKTRIPR